jgi:sugar/nucleoside kinase (ribokinase family)
MKILVIGHSVLDFIQLDKKISTSAGGIYYTILALKRLNINKDEIFLCSQYDEETFNYFSLEFDKINRSFLGKVDSIPRVHLNLFKDKERHEFYENITNNISMEICNFNEFDGILINMITGFDITLDQLIGCRKNYSGLIFMDVHTLSRGLDENYKRKFRQIPDFDKWAMCLDIIQVNQNELFTLSAQKNESEIIEEIFESGVNIICVTKGKFGAKVYFKESNEIISYFIVANKIDNPNVIGCGDVFGAAFFYSYIRNKNVIDSLSNAVATAELFVESKFL